MTRASSQRRSSPVVRVTGPTLRLSLSAWLTYCSARALGRLVWWLARRPAVAGPLAAAGGAWWAVATYGAVALVGLGLAAGVGLLGAGVAAEARGLTWHRLARRLARSRWRTSTVYRRRWRDATRAAGLGQRVDGEDRWPIVRRVTSSAGGDVVRVRMLPGQVVEDWTKAAPRLAQTFGVEELRVASTAGRVHEVELRAQRRDPLTAVVPAATPAEVPDLAAVPVGRREDGRALTLPLLYSHLLVGGETGSGKGSVIWALVAGVAPAVARGHVRLLGVDPKGGMELGAGRALFHRFVTTPEEAADLLEGAVAAMRSRAARCQAHGVRKIGTAPVEGRPDAPHIGERDPLVVVVLDELAALVAYVTDTKLRRRLGDALALLLSQGRAVGVVVVGATQDVRKETVGLRDLFPVRVGLRTAEDEAADMILGRGARERGAVTDRIRPSLPGVGFVVVDGVPEPVRVRFAYLDDAGVAQLAERYAPRPRLAAVPEPAAA